MSDWCWQRWIDPGAQEEWIARLPSGSSWVVTEKPGAKRSRLTLYFKTRREAANLVRSFGGQVVKTDAWPPRGPDTVLSIGTKLEIYSQKPRGRSRVPRLYIPHGRAFGSGEHATTLMLLRALARQENLSSVLDLGTGSGILALAARRFGAGRITALDFDPAAVRTARENERLNFRQSSIRWQKADVLKLRSKTKYELVLANLFSGILCAATGIIADTVKPGGELWMSGILRTQQEEVIAAYKKRGWQLIRATRRGKWVMLQGHFHAGTGALKKTVQTK